MLPQAMLVQNLIAMALVVGVAVSFSASRKEALVRLVAAWALLIGLVIVGTWVAPPPIAPWIYCALLAVASALHLVRSGDRDGLRLLQLSQIPTLASIGLGALLLWQGVSGRVQPDIETINLSAPMQHADGICVLSGGNSLALNAHRLSAGSPSGMQEIHSVDFVKIGPGGLRTRSWQLAPQPMDVLEYLVFDEPVFAPCDGTVLDMKNDHPDHPAGGEYRDPSGVNFVTVRCDRVDVILAHLKEGSVDVSAGQSVSVGDLLGRVGNSGNSEEPHLHIQAQTVLPEESQGAYPQPVAMTFAGKYLPKGACL